MVKSEPKKKPQSGGFFQKFFRKSEKSQKEQRLTVQRSIPYLEMGRDGICRVEEHLYSKTVRFYDINYQLAQNEDKNTIFESWCDFLNYFDASIRFQLSFINHKSDMSEYNKVIQIEPQHDAFDDVRMEYAQMLKQQLAKGNNGLVRTKYITFSIEAKSVREAKPRLERIETDILNNFKVLGVKAYPLNGVERLQIMYETFHQEEQQKFDFSYDRILQSGMTTKDFIAPTSFLFKSGKDFMMGDTYGAASYLNILAPELTDKVLAEFLDMDKNLVVSIHVQSVDQLKAIKLIKGKITDLDRMKIEEQKKAVRSGYDMEIIPSDLATYGGEAKKILDDLQSRNERMFLVTVLFLNTAKTKQELDSAVFQTAGIAQKFNCTLNRLDYLQEQGLMSSLPLANNLVPIKRALTTTSTAIFVPFTTQELFMEGDSLYYGLNAVSNNMIMADRKQLKNPNGLILGTPGSGKSFSAKREITNVFFTTTDDIIVADPEGEYYPLVEALGGQVIHISSTSKDYINPMDINLNYADDDNPLGMKSDFILSLCELIMGARDGMEPEEKSVIDRCLPLVYQKYLNDPKPENMPTLGDLYDCLREQKERQAQRIATALEIYVKDKKTGEELFYCRYCRAHKENGKNLKVPAATIYKNVMDALELEHLEEEKLAAAIQQGAGKKAIEVVRAERSVQMKSVLAELNMEQFRRVPLYESYMANEITEEQYHAELMDYEEAHRKLNEQLTAIMEDTLVWERALSLRNPWIQQVAQYKAPEELDRSFVKKHIEQVTVTLLGDGQAEIGLTMKTYEWKQMLGRIETEETDDGTKE